MAENKYGELLQITSTDGWFAAFKTGDGILFHRVPCWGLYSDPDGYSDESRIIAGVESDLDSSGLPAHSSSNFEGYIHIDEMSERQKKNIIKPTFD